MRLCVLCVQALSDSVEVWDARFELFEGDACGLRPSILFCCAAVVRHLASSLVSLEVN